VPRLDREQAVCLAVLALLVLTCLSVTGLLVRMRSDAGAELAERREILSRLQTRLRADNGRSKALAPPTAFLDAPTKAIASAQLQAYLTKLAELQNAALMSSGGEAAKRDEPSDTVRLQASLEMSLKALQAMLYQLESGTPYVFVDGLTVQLASASAGHVIDDPVLRATLSLRAFWRGGGS
jgi:general secretion pathway protein M